MKTKITRALAVLALFAVALMPTRLMANNPDVPPVTDEPNTIVEVAINNNFNTLVVAVKAAGLVETLQGDGPFTVFAPTDEAFAKLPEGTVESLLKPENRDKLIAILTYHVVPGNVSASQVVQLDEAKTVNGAMVDITVADGTVMVNNATVVATDVEASNGIVHVIDTVLLPPAKY